MALAALALGITACGDHTAPSQVPKGLANCAGTALLSVSPIDVGVIRELTPLGSLNPPAHTLPTDHVYFYATFTAGTKAVIPVLAPGDVTISEVVKQTRTGGGLPDATDYSMTFFPCADLNLYYAHVVLTTQLLAQIGAFGDCQHYSFGGFSYEACKKQLSVKLTAGTQIGIMGGDNGNIMDFGGYDRRVPQLAYINPARSYGYGTEFGANRTICPIDYFVASVAGALRAKLGSERVRRTIDPLCGTVMQDLPNTAQGRWFFNESVGDDAHLALAHDHIDPRIGVISVGTSVPSLPTKSWGFTPAASGRVNADFPRVTADGLTYCYQTFSPNPPPPLRHVLIQLVSATRVRIEGFLGALCGDPSTWAFTAGAREFAR
jgi:hypothetical protein